MAKKKTSRAAARKVRDKWKAKEWYKILAPEMFNRAQIGETPSDDPGKLMGRITEVTVQDLTGDFSKMHIKLHFKINDVRSYDAHTIFVGHDLTSDYIRRLTRRKRTKTDGVFDVYTKDKFLIRVKPMAITEKRIQSSQQTAIRGKMGEVIANFADTRTLGEFVKAVISNELARSVAQACKPIQPIKKVEIRKSEILKMGEVAPVLEEEEKAEPEEEVPEKVAPEDAPGEEVPEPATEESEEELPPPEE